MRLNTDSSETMPITDAVYGKPPRQPVRADAPGRGQRGRQLWQALHPEGMIALRNLGGQETKRFFAIRTRGI